MMGRLLEEISWEGGRVKQYRKGGQGMENVLSAQVLQALDHLPRDRFLGAVLRDAHGATSARMRVAEEAEVLELTFLPDEVLLTCHDAKVQPDATLTGPSSYCLVEAKGPGRSRFNTLQLSREYLALLEQAGERTPLMLLVLGAPPPVRLAGGGVHNPVDVIARELGQLAPVVLDARNEAALVARVPEVLAWTTWREIADVVMRQVKSIDTSDRSVASAIGRVASSLVRAVDWHSSARP
ncbi:hypothetical protein [Cellulomonas fimi]|uniref:Uncharacterized protein n=1 Tax=Cellulomonas fimi TaxID=1708 RepID=A0A7Y0LZL5_CELFI|nr:hypothetical protein [Cellulomonas fimi]NMR21147.1 hypothetical protein [Cellulomonas fimi]